MRQRMYEVDVESLLDPRVVNCKPVGTLLLELRQGGQQAQLFRNAQCRSSDIGRQ